MKQIAEEQEKDKDKQTILQKLRRNEEQFKQYDCFGLRFLEFFFIYYLFNIGFTLNYLINNVLKGYNRQFEELF